MSKESSNRETRPRVVDLFSGAGGMSYGFHAHGGFSVVGAADAQVGKPSSPYGSLGCNSTYSSNIGIDPICVDLQHVDPADLLCAWNLKDHQIDVLLACPPCTGFSRTTALNHLKDDPRNSLIGRIADYAAVFCPSVIVMENARELIMGRQMHHVRALTTRLESLGYAVSLNTHYLSRYGLPQLRERAVIIAAKRNFVLRTLDDVWKGYRVGTEAQTVRRAIAHLPAIGAGEAYKDDPVHVAPSFRSELSLRRIRAIPSDGGSWIDLVNNESTEMLLNPAQRRIVASGRLGSHPDVYGRMWWDRPARTIKRECSHVGNGRYSHPDQHRLCSVREMAILQGFPYDYRFDMSSVSNAYRHVGDAVPPLISFQLAHAVDWILTEKKPRISALCLAGTSLTIRDIKSIAEDSAAA